MELWWNTPVEQQAFARVYRMGQEKEVHVVRLRCKGTKDDDIIGLQERKEREVAECLVPGGVSELSHAALEIFKLIGMPVKGEDGVIEALGTPDVDDESDSSESDDDEIEILDSSDEEDEGDEDDSDGVYEESW